MTKREYVIKAINHEEMDKIPYQLDLTDEMYQKMIKHYDDPNFFEKTGSYLAQERNEELTPITDKTFKDMFNVVWNNEQEGDFGVVTDYILTDADFGEYKFPKPNEKLIREKCERLEKQDDKFRMYIIGFSLFERAWSLRSMEEILMDFILNKEFVHELMGKIVEYNCAVVDIVAEYDIDCIFFGDDWGQQKGLIMGPELWREFIKPNIKIMYDKVKEKGMYIAQHSCGDISDIFADLIELGLDIYNTFQPEAYDIEYIKETYGKELTFYGGISTQRLLPMATPEKVKEETKRLMKILGKGGGYIVAPTHSMPNDIPLENALAFLEVVQNQ